MKYLFLLLFPVFANAQVLSPSGKELVYSYTADFVMNAAPAEADSYALRHAYHMFGIFQSQTIVEDIGLNYDLVGGIAAPRAGMNIRILSAARNPKTGRIHVQYANSGKILVHKEAAKKILRKGAFVVPLPADIDAFYDMDCADPDYNGYDYFWYFYDPFKAGCEDLANEPYAKRVIVKVREASKVNPQITPRLDLLRGNNGNGELFSVYVVHGYSESFKKNDDGRLNFEELNEYLRSEGFDEEVLNKTNNRPLHQFTKTIRLTNGKDVQIQVKHLLADTELDIKGITFAKFFKEAVETADVVVYAGHSGLGDNVDIPGLEAKVGKFHFNAAKKQIFFFDACTSYSYYLEPFAAEKTRAKIDVLSYGLPAYFHTGEAVMERFFSVLFDPDITDMSWMNIMKSMEEPLDGGTYLLNVGGF